MTFGTNFPIGYTYDVNGNELTFKDSDGYSWERWARS
jgi:hypothetical protein